MMRKLVTIGFLLIAFILAGCGTDDSSSSSSTTNNTASSAPFALSLSDISMLGGETGSYTLSLSNTTNNSSNSLKSMAAAPKATASSEEYDITLESTNENVATISPSSCTLSADNPSCTLTITSYDLWTSGEASPVSGSSDINAYYSTNKYKLGTVETNSTKPQRRIYFENRCSFDTWVGFEASNAGKIACSPSMTDTQANCPNNFLCYRESDTNTYCVAGDINTSNYTSGYITQQNQIILKDANCPGGMTAITDNGTSWGQCACSSDSDCPSGQSCKTLSTGTLKQCFYDINISTNNRFGPYGKLDANTTEGSKNLPYVLVDINTSQTSGLLTGGKFYIKTGCDESSGAYCLSGDVASASTATAPQTLMEFTLQNDVNASDYYDVSYINGINVPAMFAPKYNGKPSIEYNTSKNGYWCTLAGATATDMNSTFDAYTDLNDSLKNFGCTYDYASQFNDTNNSRAAFNFVADGGLPCPANTCSGGEVCGLSFAHATSHDDANFTNTTCGQRLGYWTYTQFCSANDKFKNATIGIDCTDSKIRSYALCNPQTSAADEQGAGRSCFNSNQTTSGQSCCGFADWNNSSGLAQPTSSGKDSGDENVTVAYDYWTTNILPAVKQIKDNCLLAYSYQYDDPYSTFQCAASSTNAPGINTAHYKITLCPGSSNNATKSAINPPSTTCSPGYPDGNQSDFQVTPGANAQYALYYQTGSSYTLLDTNDTTKTEPFQTYQGGYVKNYKLVLTNELNTSQTQTCFFGMTINGTQPGCLYIPDEQTGDCTGFTVNDGNGSWAGRNLSIPGFTKDSNSSCTPSVPTGIDAYAFTLGVGLPNEHNTSVYLDDNTTLASSPASAIYDLNQSANDNNITQYIKVVVENNTTSQTQTCFFRVTESKCLKYDSNLTAPADATNCTTWSVSSSGVWEGRSIGVPAF